MEKIILNVRVRNEEMLHSVKEERNILHIIKRWKAAWIGQILRKNCLLQHVIEGEIGRDRNDGRMRKKT